MATKALQEWSAAVRRRDGKCAKCGATHGLAAHHIKSKTEFPELALDLSNGQTLCHNCHMEHHRRHGVARRGRQSAPGVISLRKDVARLERELEAARSEIAVLRTCVAELESRPSPAAQPIIIDAAEPPIESLTLEERIAALVFVSRARLLSA